MKAAIKPLVADRDSTFTLNVRYRLDDGEGVDLSEHTTSLVILKKSSATQVLHSYPGTADDDGHISVIVPDEETSLWQAGTFSYRLVIDLAGAPEFLLVGPFTVRTPADV